MKTQAVSSDYGWIKSKRSPELLRLIRKSNPAFILLTVIAHRVNWREPSGVDRTAIGEALVGDYSSYGLSHKQYRNALKLLVDLGKIQIVETTNKGTIVKLVSTDIYEVTFAAGNACQDSGTPEANHGQSSGRQNSNNGQSTGRPKGRQVGTPLKSTTHSDSTASKCNPESGAIKTATEGKTSEPPEANNEVTDGQTEAFRGQAGLMKGPSNKAETSPKNKEEEGEKNKHQDGAASPRAGDVASQSENPEAAPSGAAGEGRHDDRVVALCVEKIIDQYPAIVKLVTGTTTSVNSSGVARIKEFFQDNSSWGWIDVLYVGTKALIETRDRGPESGCDPLWWSRKYGTRLSALFKLTAGKDYPILRIAQEHCFYPSHDSEEELQRMIQGLLKPFKPHRQKADSKP